VTGPRHVHRAFGRTVHSDVELPSLLPGAGPDRAVVIRAGPPVERTHPGNGPPAFIAGMECMWSSPDGWLLRYEAPDSGESWTMHIERDGRTIVVERTRALKLRDIAQILQSVGLASALQLQGTLLLHGCAIDVGGEGVLVLGDSGAGKSTTAAAFVRQGLALLSDDVAALEPAGDALVVHPGPQRLWLEPQTARAMGWDPDALPQAFGTPLLDDKRQVDLSVAEGSFCAETLAIAAIFVLGARTSGPAVVIERLSAAESFATVRRKGYRAALLDRAAQAERLPLLARVAHEIPVHRVHAPDDSDALPHLVASLLATVARR
jgi:hypothetical protein